MVVPQPEKNSMNFSFSSFHFSFLEKINIVQDPAGTVFYFVYFIPGYIIYMYL